ncbi:omega-conotoxin-like protein 1 isoform X2 [Orussus abietinus]|uniref:omega-conotoxin-like protein 1 isoform X2 n=1 Tax=Orussus abietinus TaxID=222816 RepID=UPI000626E814|nr:omega-conotoxin-like protein 1 isoform X2 [Orussus abietinus]
MKLVLVLCVVVFATMVVGTPAQKDDATCGRHGDPCVSDRECCGNIKCHRYANRCQVVITQEELLAQREKILGRKGKAY